MLGADMSRRLSPARRLCMAVLPALLAAGCAAGPSRQPLAVREDFDGRGRPPAQSGISWQRKAQLSRAGSWGKIVPGDGLAHLTVESRKLCKDPLKSNFWPFKKLWLKPEWPFVSIHPYLPFQTISFGPVVPGHIIGMRAKSTAIPGVACFLFTYREKRTFDEIDIEIVPADTGREQRGAGGWTDVRLNTWAEADRRTLLPMRVHGTPVRDASGARVSHADGRFHVYTIDWRRDAVRFSIDGVLQHAVTGLVPQRPARVIVGMRQAPWSGGPPWQGARTMLVDWVSVKPAPPVHGSVP